MNSHEQPQPLNRTFNPKVVGSIPTGGTSSGLVNQRFCGPGVFRGTVSCPQYVPRWAHDLLVSAVRPP